MEKISFDYEIDILVKFTQEEFDLLWDAFDSCNETRRYQNVGEFMYGNKNRQGWGDSLRFSWSELDKSLKACEIAAIDTKRRVEFNELYGKIYKFMGQMSDEYRRIRQTNGK